MMYTRMGPSDKDYIELDSVKVWNRTSMNDYIRRLECLRDTMWPLKPEEKEAEQ